MQKEAQRVERALQVIDRRQQVQEEKARKLEEKAQRQAMKQVVQAAKKAESKAKEAAKSKSTQIIAAKPKKQHVVVGVDCGSEGVRKGVKVVSARTTRTRAVVLPRRYL